MADRKRARDEIKDTRRHNLKVLNPHRRRQTLAPSLTAVERERGLRFILQSGQASTPDRVAEAVWNRHGLVVDVRPLFGAVDPGADANGMERFFLATLPGLAQRDVADDVFDIGYTLADTPAAELVSVEPDVPHAVFHGTPEIAIAGDLNPCAVNAAAPEDRAWHLRTMRVPRAWALEPPNGGHRFGRGSIVGHIDTGWVPHDDFTPANVRLDLGRDFVENDTDPRDPLESGSFLGGPRSPGHGTATSSVIIGRGDGSEVLPDPAQLELWGVAPGAALIPFRAIRFVFFVFDSDVAEAIQFAADQGCHVISMSLGGVPTTALEAAVNYAVAKNVIVCAAAGNCLPSVSVGPAVYPNCIAVAGCNIEDRPWQFSSRGAKVAVTAPAENVWVARRIPGESSTANRTAGEGTSFAVAGVAGVAALWLAFHGRDRLLERYQGAAFLQHVFQHLLRQTARASDLLPAGQFGSGIVDAHALLAATLPDPAEVTGPPTVADLAVLSQEEVIAAMLGNADPNAVRAQVTSLLGGGSTINAQMDGGDSQATVAGQELIHLLAQDRSVYLQFSANLGAPDAVEAAPRATALVGAADRQLVDEVQRGASHTLVSRMTVVASNTASEAALRGSRQAMPRA
jgi:subtilisin family serine protease